MLQGGISLEIEVWEPSDYHHWTRRRRLPQKRDRVDFPKFYAMLQTPRFLQLLQKHVTLKLRILRIKYFALPCCLSSNVIFFHFFLHLRIAWIPRTERSITGGPLDTPVPPCRRDRGSPALGVMQPIAILSRLQVAEAQLIVLDVADTAECGHGRWAPWNYCLFSQMFDFSQSYALLIKGYCLGRPLHFHNAGVITPICCLPLLLHLRRRMIATKG